MKENKTTGSMIIMNKQIIVDSCCDMTPEMKEEMGVVSVPLTMRLGDTEYCDDASLDLDAFVDAVKNFAGKAGSAAPSPYLYQQAIENSEDAYVVTLSSKLSGSYNSAVIGNKEPAENHKGAAYIFDSKSASAGETLVAIKIHELLKEGASKEKIIEVVSQLIDKMKTYFVLENYDNLQKNGRMSKVTGVLVQILNIKLIMGSNGDGEIALFAKCRGMKHMLQQLLSLVENSGKDTRGENLVISHCNNPGLAQQLSDMIKERCDFKKIYIVPTAGLSSLYADDHGVILAF